MTESTALASSARGRRAVVSSLGAGLATWPLVSSPLMMAAEWAQAWRLSRTPHLTLWHARPQRGPLCHPPPPCNRFSWATVSPGKVPPRTSRAYCPHERGCALLGCEPHASASYCCPSILDLRISPKTDVARCLPGSGLMLTSDTGRTQFPPLRRKPMFRICSSAFCRTMFKATRVNRVSSHRVKVSLMCPIDTCRRRALRARRFPAT